MRKFNQLWRSALAMALVLCMAIGMIPAAAAAPADQTDSSITYPTEDAWIRAQRGHLNDETLSGAHAPQYANKGYRALSMGNKSDAAGKMWAILKFPLPQGDFNHYELQVTVAHTPNCNEGAQTYEFYYSEDMNWSSSNVTWDSYAPGHPIEADKKLCQFHVAQGDFYNKKPVSEQTITMDVTDQVRTLAERGVKEITVIGRARDVVNTTAMIHSSETAAPGSQERQQLSPKLIGSRVDYRARLNELIAKYQDLKQSDYLPQGWTTFAESLSNAKTVARDPASDDTRMLQAANTLEQAAAGLKSASDSGDPLNVAFGKPTRSSLNRKDTARVTDGQLNTAWKGAFYPGYVDIDLLQQYDITDLQIFMPVGKSVYYTVYGSNDGRNFDRLYQNRDDAPCTEAGDTVTFESSKSYRIIRVFCEWTKGEAAAYLSEVRVHGTATDTNTQALRTGSFREILGIDAYADTKYADPITETEIIENVYGLIDRTVGPEYRSWFTFRLTGPAENGNDYFALADVDGKIQVSGNEGLSLASGLNYYYKHFAGIQVSEQTVSGTMPQKPVPVGGNIRKETPFRVRYAYNYCTLSYTFAFFGEEDWQRENDWLALNGVNVVLDLAGQEATWIKFLMELGYDYDSAKDWLCGPGYYAWQFMDNMETFGGPIPDQYVIDRVELARSSRRWKNSLGMQTILQGYAGMVPTNFAEVHPEVTVLKQGGWNGSSRPDMIRTDSALYDQYAALFYQAQAYIYGTGDHYYAVDPFHEGGKRPSDLSDQKIAQELLQSLLAYDPEAVWTVQAWQSNPTKSLLAGMGENRVDHVMILDLIKYPLKSWTKYDNADAYGGTEFAGTSWVWGLLGNFGGTPTMNGELETMLKDIQNARKTCEHMIGIGILSEAIYDNPVVYELLMELVWEDNLNLNQWLQQYVQRRYGASTPNAQSAWKIMKDTNYNYGVRHTTEIFGMKGRGPQNIGRLDIPYGAENLQAALELLAADFDALSGSAGYRYDLREIMRQHVSNYAVLKHNQLLDARDAKDVEAYAARKAEFLNALELMDLVESTDQDQLVGEWIGKAHDRAVGCDDFTHDLFDINARALITAWGGRGACNALRDYAWRNYSGLFTDLYAQTWINYLNVEENNLKNGTNQKFSVDYPDLYWHWILNGKTYTRDAADSAQEIRTVLDRVLKECRIETHANPDIGNIAFPGIAQVNGKQTPVAQKLHDGKDEPAISGIREAQIDLIGEFSLSKLQLTFAGEPAAYTVSVSIDGEQWTQLGSGSEAAMKLSGTARFVKITGQDLSLSEIRVYGDQILADQPELKRLIAFAESVNTATSKPAAVVVFQNALKTAKALSPTEGPDTVSGVYWNLYDALIAMDYSGLVNVALHKPVTSYNEIAGAVPGRITDGSNGSGWDAGRLSQPGVPYDPAVYDSWAIIDLKGLYTVEQIQTVFTSQNWVTYEMLGSTDGEHWTVLGTRTSHAKPNSSDDTLSVDGVTCRYIKLQLTNGAQEPGGKRFPVGVGEVIVLGKPVSLQVSGTNMTLGNELAMNFMVKKSDVTDLTGLSLQITKIFADGREPVVITVPAESWISYNKYYKVTFDDISAKEMTDDITAVVLRDGKPAGDVYTDSVAAYALRILRKNETKAELKSVIIDMLNYGTEAQMQFQYHEEKLANAELTELDQYWASETPYARDARVKGDRYFGSNLNLGSNMALTMYFKGITPDMHAEIAYVKHTGDPKTVTVSGADFVKFNNTVYGIRADMLVVADAKQLVTVKVYDADNKLIASASDSVAGYLTRVENVDALGDAILKFSASAKRYFKNSTAASATLKPQDFGIDLDQLIADGVLQHKSFTDPETGITMWYWISVPADYETRSYPVVTMFHGYGEGGDGIPDKSGSDGPDKIRNNLSMNSGIIYALLAEHNRRDYPCIILAPQTPCLQDGTARSKWVDMGPSWNHSSRDMDANPRTPNLTTALHILQNVVQTCNADADRLYLTGLSMGGMAAWDLGTGNPELFAALAPICGIGDPAKAEQLQDMPIHAFHGMKDPVVPVEACKTMWNALRGYGNMSSTLFPYEFHGSWNYVYGPEYVQGLIRWMFNQSKSGPLDGCADKRPLRQLLMQAQQADPHLYTPDGWDRLQSVFRDANAVLNRSQATAAELRNASRALTDALEAQKKQSNLALTATVASSVPATYKTTLAGLNDGIIQDNKANFTVFANTALPTISYTWAEPQSVEGVEVVTFVAQKFGVQKYELLYTTTENPEPVSLGVHSITWTTNSNQDYESNQWILDTPLDHVTSLQFHILQGGRDTYCTFQELKVLG